MTTLFAVWNRKKGYYKFVCVTSANTQFRRDRLKRKYAGKATMFIRVPDRYVNKVKRGKFCMSFYEWQTGKTYDYRTADIRRSLQWICME